MRTRVDAALWLFFVGILLFEAVTRLCLTRWLFRRVTYALMTLDLYAVAFVRYIKPPRYELVGACQKRGACCTQIVADPPHFIKHHRLLTSAYLGLHRAMHNFHLVGRGPEGQLVMRCGFIKTDGRCGIYKFRPRLCRTYPLLPFFSPPSLLPGCGYRVKLRGMNSHPRLPVVMPHVGVHHPTPVRRAGHELEYVEDFRLVEAAGGVVDQNIKQEPS